MAMQINDIEKRLSQAADELRANSRLRASEFSVPVLGLISLGYDDHRFTKAQKKLGDLVQLSFGAGGAGPLHAVSA